MTRETEILQKAGIIHKQQEQKIYPSKSINSELFADALRMCKSFNQLKNLRSTNNQDIIEPTNANIFYQKPKNQLKVESHLF